MDSFFFLLTFGTYYVRFILKNYSGNLQEVYISWILFSIVTSYSFYTMYLDALLLGKGLVKRSKQIAIVGQFIYLTVSIVLIFFHLNLLAIVFAKIISVVFTKYFYYKTIYTKEFKQHLRTSTYCSKKEIFKIISPNALKVGLTSISGFFVNQFIILICPFFISLQEIASYGITQQLIGFISLLSNAYYFVYQSKIYRYRIKADIISIKRIYLQGLFLWCMIFFCFGSGLLFCGKFLLSIIGSQIHLLSRKLIAVALVIAGLEANHYNSACILLAKNEVPFFYASMVSGLVTVMILFVYFQYSKLSIYTMILIPGIIQVAYQNWKWPLEVFKELHITKYDIISCLLYYKQILERCLFIKKNRKSDKN